MRIETIGIRAEEIFHSRKGAEKWCASGAAAAQLRWLIAGEDEMGVVENDGGEDRAFGGHGDVYRWLRSNYTVVKAWIENERPSFETIAGRISRAGVLGRRGEPPTRRSVWKVWKRVSRDVKADTERAEREEAQRLAKQRELLAGVRTNKRPGTALAPIGPPLAAPGGGSASEARVLTRPDGQRESSVERNKRVIKERLEKSKNPAWARFEKGEDDGMRD